MSPEPIRDLGDARAVADSGTDAFDTVRQWIGNSGGPDLAADLEPSVIDIAWRFDAALDELRNRYPDLDTNDEP